MTSNETREVVSLRDKIADFIDANAEVRGEYPSDHAILVNADELADSIVKLIPLAWSSPAPATGGVDAVLRYYADTFCELDPHHESCGKLSKDECSGCLARSTLSQPPTSGSEAGAEIARLAKELDCDAEPATVFRAALNLAKQSVKPASSPVVEAVKMKPLEWQGSAKGNFFARVLWGTYHVEKDGERWTWFCHWAGTTACMLNPCDDEDTGKAGAQAHFDNHARSLLSALDTEAR